MPDPQLSELAQAAERLLTAYREKYARPSAGGVRNRAPLRQEMGELAAALNAVRTRRDGTDRVASGQAVIDQSGNETAKLPQRRRHTWGPSRVGHGEAQCLHCLMTNREAAVLRLGEFCLDA